MGPALNPSNNDTALFFFNGFNSYDADPIVEQIGSDVQHVVDGQKISVSYGNAPLNEGTFDGFANEVKDYSKKNGIKTAVIVTYSMGCIPGTMTGQKLTEDPDHSPLVSAFIYISCPSGYDALRDKTQDEVDFVKTVSHIPFVQYSRPVRLGGEIYFLNQEYEHGDPWQAVTHLNTLVPNAIDDINSKDATGTWTIFDQALLAEQGHFDDRLKSIADNTKNSLTSGVFYFGTGKGGYDTVLDDKKSGRDIATDAQKAGLPHLNYAVPDAVHGEIWRSKKQYAETFAAAKLAIQEVLGSERDTYNLNHLGLFKERVHIR